MQYHQTKVGSYQTLSQINTADQFAFLSISELLYAPPVSSSWVQSHQTKVGSGPRGGLRTSPEGLAGDSNTNIHL